MVLLVSIYIKLLSTHSETGEYHKSQTSHSEISQMTTTSLRRPKCSITNRFIFIFPWPLHAIAFKSAGALWDEAVLIFARKWFNSLEMFLQLSWFFAFCLTEVSTHMKLTRILNIPPNTLFWPESYGTILLIARSKFLVFCYFLLFFVSNSLEVSFIHCLSIMDMGHFQWQSAYEVSI